MPLDPVAQRMIDETRASGRPNAHLLPVAAARRRFEETLAALRKPEVHETRELSIPTRDGERIRARLYVPAAEPAPGLALYFHGGGWLLGSIDSHDTATRSLALASGVPVLSVDYRRGPEHRFPVAFEDGVDALLWATDPDHLLPVREPHRVALAGDSAGGNLAAAIANALRGQEPRIRHQLLVYPITTLDLQRGLDPEFDGIMLERDELKWHQDNYLASAADLTDVRVSVLDDDLSGAPDATIVLAECDPVRPQGELYAAALRAAGVPVEVHRTPGMVHGFFGLDEIFPAAGAAMAFAGRRLRTALA